MIKTNNAFANFKQANLQLIGRKPIIKVKEKEEESHEVALPSVKTPTVENSENSGIIYGPDKAEMLNNLKKIAESQKETHDTKENLLAMGFTEEDIDKYFYETLTTVIINNRPTLVKKMALHKNIELNGRAVNTIGNLNHELVYAPLVKLFNKIRAGVVPVSELTSELAKMGATGISTREIPHEPLGRTEVSFTYKGENFRVVPEVELKLAEKPTEEYDENGEVIKRKRLITPYTRGQLVNFDFTDADIAEYFDKQTIKQQYFGGGIKETDIYTLKKGIVINGFEVKSVQELWYFIVIEPLKNNA